MPKEGLITRNEVIFLAVVSVFSVIWMLVVVPYFSASIWFQHLIPPYQFMIFELGFIVGLIAAVGFPIQYLYFKLKRRSKTSQFSFISGALKIGVSFWAGNKLILDSLEPPFFISTSGHVLLNNPDAMTGTAVDATVAWMWQQLGISGFGLYLATYVVFPIVCLTLIILAFTWKRVVQMFSGT